MSGEHHSPDKIFSEGKGRDFARYLAARLGIESDPFALIRTFKLNLDGSIDEKTKAALEAIQKREGYSLYEVIIAKVDTEHARQNYSAGSMQLGTITDTYLLANISNAFKLHELNMAGIGRNVMGKSSHTFETAIVAQAQHEVVKEIGSWTLSSNAIMIG